MNSHHHVIIVGSGPAGLAAAGILSGHGLDILIIDDNPIPGGQFLRRPPAAVDARRRWPGPLKGRVQQLVGRLKRHTIGSWSEGQVLGIFEQRTLLVETSAGRVIPCRADTLILATGARERQLPFPGWTLPGVIAVGAAQIMMKSSGILPGKRTVVGGGGPLLMVLAAEILAAGGQVPAVLEQGTAVAKLGVAAAGPAAWPGLFRGAACLARLAVGRIPVRQGVRIVEARGRRQLEEVVAARIDSRGHPVTGSEEIYTGDTLAVGYGFVPNTELARQAGCALAFDADKGGWHVQVDTSMKTTVAGIYAAGEVTGIAGAAKSYIEGSLSAWRILYERGRVKQRAYTRMTQPLIRRRLRQVRYGRRLNRLCNLAPDFFGATTDDTVVCRCETVTMGEIRRQIANGFVTMDSIKKATRCGMGICQGRICGPILVDILSVQGGQSPEAVGPTSARPPVRAVSLGALAEMAPVEARDYGGLPSAAQEENAK